MSFEQNLGHIALRYNGLAEQACCLSCGGASELAKAQPGETCLDLGSGRGEDILRLAEQVGPQGRAYGVDTAEAMIERARRTAQKLGIANAQFMQAAFDALPLAPSSIDLVISNCAINHAADKNAVWREIYRVLRPGGRFVVSDIYALAEVPDEYRSDPQAVAECWAGAIEKPVYLASLTQAGFADVTIKEESTPYPKGKIEVASFTIAGRKPVSRCACGH
ncbi:MAG: methyltransferase domain-containing protein [Myxococcota bacterium]